MAGSRTLSDGDCEGVRSGVLSDDSATAITRKSCEATEGEVPGDPIGDPPLAPAPALSMALSDPEIPEGV